MINNFKVIFLHTFSSRSMHYPNTDDKQLYTIHHIDTAALAAAVKGSMQPVNSKKGKAACYDGCSEESANTGGGAMKKHLIVSSELIAEPIGSNTWIFSFLCTVQELFCVQSC